MYLTCHDDLLYHACNVWDQVLTLNECMAQAMPLAIGGVPAWDLSSCET